MELVTVVTAVVNWLISIFTGKPPDGIHRLLCAYIRYQAHLGAYLSLVGNPYPGFVGEAGEYPIDLRLPEEPVVQPRWTILIRLVLGIPALLVSAALAGSLGGSFSSSAKARAGRRRASTAAVR